MNEPSARRRVVVTGLGPVSPVGIGLEPFWTGLTSGLNGTTPITRFDASDFPVRIAAELKGFDAGRWMEPKEIKRTDRVVHYAVAAARMAWEDAGAPAVEPSRAGVIFSTGIGGLETLVRNQMTLMERGPGRVSAFFVPGMMPNASAGHVAMALGFTGPNECITTACAAGGHAIGEAYRLIREQRADLAVAGGTEAVIMPITIAGFAQMQALSKNPDPESASRPFDAGRDGFVLGEGSGALVLEEASRAVARGARIYAEVAGFGASADAYHITAPEPEGSGAILAIQQALDDAGEPAEAVGYVNAHGTSTPLNDSAETKALKKAFGDHAYRVPVSSTKSMTGHLLGAAGAVEAVATAMVVSTGILPPTIHHETPDPECDLDYVPNTARKADVRVALSNAFGFGGQNAVLAFRRWEG